MDACTHPEEWQSLTGKCLLCGAAEPLDAPIPTADAADRARLRRECDHPPSFVYGRTCFLCGEPVRRYQPDPKRRR